MKTLILLLIMVSTSFAVTLRHRDNSKPKTVKQYKIDTRVQTPLLLENKIVCGIQRESLTPKATKDGYTQYSIICSDRANIATNYQVRMTCHPRINNIMSTTFDITTNGRVHTLVLSCN